MNREAVEKHGRLVAIGFSLEDSDVSALDLSNKVDEIRKAYTIDLSHTIDIMITSYVLPGDENNKPGIRFNIYSRYPARGNI